MEKNLHDYKTVAHLLDLYPDIPKQTMNCIIEVAQFFGYITDIIKIGNSRLINYDQFCQFLLRNQMEQKHEKH